MLFKELELSSLQLSVSSFHLSQLFFRKLLVDSSSSCLFVGKGNSHFRSSTIYDVRISSNDCCIRENNISEPVFVSTKLLCIFVLSSRPFDNGCSTFASSSVNRVEESSGMSNDKLNPFSLSLICIAQINIFC